MSNENYWLVWTQTISQPRQTRLKVPTETRILDYRISDILLILTVFPILLGMYTGVLAILLVLGWRP